MRIGIIGVGNMGRSVAKIVSENMNYSDFMLVSDIKHLTDYSSLQETNIENIKGSNILFLCVKPNDMTNLLTNIENTLMTNKLHNRNPLIVSCAAKLPLNFYDRLKLPVIRCMPNIPIAERSGAITYIPNNKVTDDMIKNFEKILAGPFLLKVNEEKLIDLSTILGGCMPALISYLSQAIIKFGTENGFTIEEAQEIYLNTAIGTMKLLQTNSPEDIIKMVSSPNGITAKLLESADRTNMKKILSDVLNESLTHTRYNKD